jgi:hypothetical protein
MATDVGGFYWLVREGGLGWPGSPAVVPPAEGKAIDAEQRPGEFAPPGPPKGSGPSAADSIEMRSVPEAAAYNALRSHSGLFMSLAKSARDPAGIKSFFDRFAQRQWGRRGPWPVPSEELPSTLGGSHQTLEKWARQAREMERLTDLWEWVKKQDRLALRDHIQWREYEGKRQVLYDPREYVRPRGQRHAAEDRPEVIASPEVRPEWLDVFVPGDVALPAAAFLQAKINEHLTGGVRLGMLYDVDGGRLRLTAVPKDLLTALWLQFAHAVDGVKDFGQCRECGAWFELSPEVARTNRRFCSDACRLRRYRQRQGRARSMHAEGVPLDVIAEELESDVATVNRWIKGPRSRRA